MDKKFLNKIAVEMTMKACYQVLRDFNIILLQLQVVCISNLMQICSIEAFKEFFLDAAKSRNKKLTFFGNWFYIAIDIDL